MSDEPSIAVTPGGPYVVSGGVPLKEMAPVHTLNGEAVDWHQLREIATPSESYELCRCGRSNDKPFCDGSHEERAWPDAERAATGPATERAQHIPGPDGVLFDDKSLCFHAGFCASRTTDAWTLVTSDDPDDRERGLAMVRRCPSGRLWYVPASTGTADEPDLPQEVAVIPGGPLWVRGGIPVESAEGRVWEVANRRSLCRCGASKIKPFCDGTHSSLHFDER